jgi:AsmA protein
MTGAGTVDLPARQLNFRVEPQLVATLEGQGGNKDIQGLGMPVIIVGPWARPKIYPDIKGILEDPVAAYERLRQFGGGLVKLPGVDNLGDTSSLPAIIVDGKINKDALKQGLGEILGNKQPGEEAPTEQKAKEKSGKDKGAKAAKKDKTNKKRAEEATKQLLQSLFGN